MPKKNKIGIITLSASDNCGSLLQAYALKVLLESISDYSVEMINFSTIQSHKMYDIFEKSDLRHVRRLLLKIKYYSNLKSHKRDYCLFREQYLGINCKSEIFPNNLKKIDKLYDVIVAGSDQVWNVSMGDFDNAFFGGWSNKKKIAYAPSLGGHDLNESRCYDDIRKWLNDFYALSVREEKGRNSILQAVPDADVPVVLDPTLAVDESIWKELVGEPIIKKKYIFYYSWAYCDNELNAIVKEEADKMKCDVYVVDAKKWFNKDVAKWNFILFEHSGPLAFLNLMYYAEQCFVQSFHGMIFAYIFKKNFWLLDTHREFEELDTRLRELIMLLHMKERILTPFNYKELELDKEINYVANPKLQEYRKKSVEYLNNALKE